MRVRTHTNEVDYTYDRAFPLSWYILGKNDNNPPGFCVWIDRLRRSNVRILIDGKGRFLDNTFVERLWRSLKYKCSKLLFYKSSHLKIAYAATEMRGK